jgi:hypothetical protein
MIGDSLLDQINDKLGLEIDIEKPKFRIYKEVDNALKNQLSLLIDLNGALRCPTLAAPTVWPWFIKEHNLASSY